MAENVGPTALGKVAIALFVLVLLAGAGYFFRGLIFPSGQQVGDVDIDAFRDQSGLEAADTQGITTVSEYNYVPTERLPPVSGMNPAERALGNIPSSS